MKLLETLTHFNGGSSVSELCEKFSEIASVFLYGGYIDVNNIYRIYIKTVEFYFHSEAENGVHDPIVYHRNKNEQEIPYFPLMTITLIILVLILLLKVKGTNIEHQLLSVPMK